MAQRPWAPAPVTAAYRQLLEAVREAGNEIGPGYLTSHWPLLGASPRRCVVVGQATFGWIPNWTVSDLRSTEGFEAVLSNTQAPCYDREDPMSWIAENRARSSPFWQCVRRVSEDYFRDAESAWYSHVAWTNLYPVAPNDLKANPSGALLEAQQPHATRLLDEVVAAVRPEFVLVLAGSYWKRYAHAIGLADTIDVVRPLFAVGHRGGIPWVAGMHPMGAQLRGWPALDYARIMVITVRQILVNANRS